MKFFVTALLLASSVTAFAGDRAIYDVMYFPKAGTIFGATDLGYAKGKSTQHDSTTNEDIVDLKISGYVVEQTLGYSVMDNLLLTASMSYSNVDIDADIDGASDQSLTNNGESDPSVGARFRVMDSEYLLDIIANVEIATGDAKVATDDKDGNNKNGGNIANVAVEFGQKTQDLQYAVQFGYTHIFEATEKDDGVKNDINAHSAYNVRFVTLHNIAEKSYLSPFIEMTITNAYNDEAGVKTQNSTRFDLGAEYKYLLSADLLLRAGAKYTNTENAVVGTVETREDCLYTFNVGATYQF
jgi:hypothetical protein